jgi:hypothetical protein
MFQTEFVEKIKTHLLCSILENPGIYEIMWKNLVEPERPQITVWCMRISHWIPKATNTHTQNM